MCGQVLDFELQRQLVPYMKDMVPLPGIYDPDFIAANQDTRADHCIKGSRQLQLEAVRADIRAFQQRTGVDKVVILWTANTERYSDVSSRTPPALQCVPCVPRVNLSPGEMYFCRRYSQGINRSLCCSLVPVLPDDSVFKMVAGGPVVDDGQGCIKMNQLSHGFSQHALQTATCVLY